MRANIERSDGNDFAVDFFAVGFQFYVLKLGVGHRLADFMEMAAGVGSAYHGIVLIVDLIADYDSRLATSGWGSSFSKSARTALSTQ